MLEIASGPGNFFMAAGGRTSPRKAHLQLLVPLALDAELMDRDQSISAFRRQPPPVRFDHACLGSESMPMEFDTPFDRWLRANEIRPRRLAREADVSRPTVLRIRKGSLGRAATRAKLAATCSTFIGRRVTESGLFWIGSR